ncbi:hypothetical protein [Pengzhenrongella phosphoraccumulans]|uniref:hypothetical protein n=1 Tax=Pengzhenrongella phosphoraccumulans TaxID=3114394 RepID=UPI00388FC89A
MTDPERSPAPVTVPVLSRRGATSVAAASGLAAVASYGVLVIAARTLSPASNADFLAFWAALFGLFGVLGGTQNEATRAVRNALRHPLARGPRVLGLNLLIGALLAGAVGVSAPLWAGAVFAWDPPLSVLILCLAIVAFAGHSGLAGALSGQGRWTAFAGLVSLEATMRFAIVGVVAIAGATMAGLEAAAAAAAASWLLLIGVSSSVRAATSARADVPARAYLRRAGQAMVAAASSAIIIVGFPVLLRLTTPDAAYALAAPLILAVSLTRAPLLIPLGAYQGVAITHFLAHPDDGLRSLRRLAGMLVAAGAVGAAAAYVVGPTLMVLLFGRDYRVDGLVLAGLTLSAVMLALLTLTGAATLALDRHTAYSAGWLLATATSIGLLLLPCSIELRTVLSLALGPVVGLVVHSAALRRGAPGAR